MHLEHVNITVSDLPRSIDFYCRLLGLRVRWRRGASDTLPAAAHVGTDDQYIAMFQAAPDTPPRGLDYAAPGVNHFGFVVDDLDAARARLEALGISPGEEQSYDPGRRLYFLDPDGIEVELVQYEPAAVAQPS